LIVADTPKPGRGKPRATRFQVFEAHPTAHLTEEQKKWKVVKLRPAREHFEVLEQQPTFVLKLHLREQLPEVDQVLAENIFALVQAISMAERELGGGGLILSNRWAEPGAVILTLRHVNPEGATERSAKLATLLNNTVQQAKLEAGEGVLEPHDTATISVAEHVQLLLAGPLNVSRCEVLTVAV
jgi:hypothetical protein